MSLDKQNAWILVNDKLLKVSESLITEMDKIIDTRPDYRIILGYLKKATNTLKAIQLLAKESLFEQAQILTRTLFELRVTFDCFVDMSRKDPQQACQRVIDAIMLEKIKQLESVDYQFGASKESQIGRDKWESAKAEINKHYTPTELKAIRKYGFTGQSVEERCRNGEHTTAYNIIYRNFSRNVHSTDYVEHTGESMLDKQEWEKFLISRNNIMLYTAHFSVGGVTERINSILGGIMDAELDAIGKEQEELRK